MSAWMRACLAPALVMLSLPAGAHEVPAHIQLRLEDGDWLDYLWTGAEHMLTGYDHLLFLLGVVFFLQRFMDILRFITAFTLGHTLVLIGASVLQISANHTLVDAFIALTVVYKGVENMGGFERLLGTRPPDLLLMVFVFGLVHGLGLATQVQLINPIGEAAWLGNLLAFNLGVELGQVAALAVMVSVLRVWRQTPVWPLLCRLSHGLLLTAGVLLFLYQMHDYLHEQRAEDSSGEWHRHGDGPLHRH